MSGTHCPHCQSPRLTAKDFDSETIVLPTPLDPLEEDTLQDLWGETIVENATPGMTLKRAYSG